MINRDANDQVNPFSKSHGAPGDAERHVGDLGNFKTDAEGNAAGTMQDKLVKLIGAESVLGVCFFFFFSLVFASGRWLMMMIAHPRRPCRYR